MSDQLVPWSESRQVLLYHGVFAFNGFLFYVFYIRVQQVMGNNDHHLQSLLHVEGINTGGASWCLRGLLVALLSPLQCHAALGMMPYMLVLGRPLSLLGIYRHYPSPRWECQRLVFGQALIKKCVH